MQYSLSDGFHKLDQSYSCLGPDFFSVLLWHNMMGGKIRFKLNSIEVYTIGIIALKCNAKF